LVKKHPWLKKQVTSREGLEEMEALTESWKYRSQTTLKRGAGAKKEKERERERIERAKGKKEKEVGSARCRPR
jgi:hypothetical protein